MLGFLDSLSARVFVVCYLVALDGAFRLDSTGVCILRRSSLGVLEDLPIFHQHLLPHIPSAAAMFPPAASHSLTLCGKNDGLMDCVIGMGRHPMHEAIGTAVNA